MLPARYRLTRSTDFGATVRHGVRAAQPDLVVHTLHDENVGDGPKVGLVVSKSVGSAVQRHRVARQLRHVAYKMISEGLSDLEASDLVVIRALPGSNSADSARLDSQLRAALKRTRVQRRARS